MPDGLLAALIVAALGALAVAAGSPITQWVFRRVDAPSRRGPRPGVTAAQAVLRGGRWIGMLERAAAFVGILAGWPESVAVVVAVKGLGRYGELRSASPGAAERFIIGTLTSLVWGCVLAVLARRLVRGDWS